MSFHIVLIPESENPQHLEFETQEQLTEGLTKLVNKIRHGCDPAQVFLFQGDRIWLSKPAQSMALYRRVKPAAAAAEGEKSDQKPEYEEVLRLEEPLGVDQNGRIKPIAHTY